MLHILKDIAPVALLIVISLVIVGVMPFVGMAANHYITWCENKAEKFKAWRKKQAEEREADRQRQKALRDAKRVAENLVDKAFERAGLDRPYR